MLTRRDFSLGLASTAFGGLALSGCGKLNYIFPGFGTAPMKPAHGYGALVPDPHSDPLLDLPAGFEYSIISRAGEPMSDSPGLVVPGDFDGMGAFALDEDRIVLVRNHELARGGLGAFENGVPPGQKFYRDESPRAPGKPLPGGTSTIIYNRSTGEVRQKMSLAGTMNNCAGGATPWGTWLTCEEVDDDEDGHGWVFEVPADPRIEADPVPLTGLGRFRHEAAAVDPRTGIVYLTEDQHDGLFYRFVPNEPRHLAAGGTLQALKFRNARQDSRNWNGVDFLPGEDNARSVDWITMADSEAASRPLRRSGARAGAARFGGGEGIYFGTDDRGEAEIYFCCTIGGPRRNGQIMRYRPSAAEGEAAESAAPGRLELFLETTDPWTFKNGDNLAIAPNGDLIVCEESYVQLGGRREIGCLKGVTPQGEVYTLARPHSRVEFAGVCFSPGGDIMFVNIYAPGKTLAIRGRWGAARPGWCVPQAGRPPPPGRHVRETRCPI